ncbi:1-phosphatidylinositol phosphodiesterase [Ceratocystis lukuohia]|uniref:1-phosphatidylinositol phosphodiesterase n=1 Tax=Ceratocystis lukuohia TaxID=2019550 RepID=A0ABR4MAD5_9PEZI
MRFSFFAILTTLALTRAGTLGGIEDPWSFDMTSSGKRNIDWMDMIADKVLLSQLSIPGTHGSMTDRLSDSQDRRQNMPLFAQLGSGIRYFEVTCQYMAAGYLRVYHGEIDTLYILRTVLNEMSIFLDEHPRETIILRIQENNIHSNIEKFISHFNKFITPDNGHSFTKRVYYKPDDGISTVPTLSEVRGKILILQDFPTSPAGLHGLPWDSPSVSNYNPGMSGTYFSALKWTGVLANIKHMDSSSSNKLHITHTSATDNTSPISVAAGTTYNAGMNRRLGEYLEQNAVKKIGVIAMDFPGQNLIDHIVKLNNDYRVADDDLITDHEVPPAESG